MAVIGSGGGPNIAGRKEQKKPAKTRHPSQPGGPGNRSAVKRGTSRDILSKMPPTIVEDFNRRAAEVEFAKESWQWSGNLDGAYEKYGELISRKRLQAIYNKPDKYIKQLGIGADSAIKNQQGLASIKGFQKYVNKTLTEAAEKTRQLNKYLFPGGHDRSNIVKSIHFGHGQGLMAGGANIGGSYTAQMPLDNMRQGKQSGPSRGAIGSDGWYKVDDAYSAIDHPQFWDEAWSNYILGKDMPILVELTDDAKNKVLHKGYNPDRVIIEQDNINLNRIDDDVAESIPFRRKGPPPKGGILTINGRPPDPIQPTPQVTERGKRLGGIGHKRQIATTATLGSLGVLGAFGAPMSIAGGAERLKIAEQTGSWTDYLAAGLEGVSAFGDVWGLGGELISTPADLTLLAMDAPETYKALMHRSDPEIEHAAQKQKEQDSVTSYTAQVGMNPQQRLVERSNTRQQQYKDKLTAHRAGREQEKQWQLEGQDYVTQTPNIAERANQTLTKIVTNPLNEIKWGYKQLLDFTKTFRN